MRITQYCGFQNYVCVYCYCKVYNVYKYVNKQNYFSNGCYIFFSFSFHFSFLLHFLIFFFLGVKKYPTPYWKEGKAMRKVDYKNTGY